MVPWSNIVIMLTLLLSTMTCFVSKIGVQALNACKNPHFNEVLLLSFNHFFLPFLGFVEKSEDGKISITGQGFEDPEGEELSYRCGYIEEGEKTKYHAISSWSMDNTCEDVLLPEGRNFVLEWPREVWTCLDMKVFFN